MQPDTPGAPRAEGGEKGVFEVKEKTHEQRLADGDVWCRGDPTLGTACGKCVKCRKRHEQQLRDEAFDNLLMDDKKGKSYGN